MSGNRTNLDRKAWRSHPGMQGPAGMLLSAHDGFRRATSALVEESGRDAPNWPAVAALFTRLDQALHAHHHAEEQGMFPRLVAAGIGVDTLLEDHQELFSALDGVRDSFQDPASLSPDAIDRFAAVLHDHLEAEENAAVPYLLEHPWF